MSTTEEELMIRLRRLRLEALLSAGILLILSGCAGAPVDKTLQTEELLGTAGFQLKIADKPATLERIGRIPIRGGHPVQAVAEKEDHGGRDQHRQHQRGAANAQAGPLPWRPRTIGTSRNMPTKP